MGVYIQCKCAPFLFQWIFYFCISSCHRLYGQMVCAGHWYPETMEKVMEKKISVIYVPGDKVREKTVSRKAAKKYASKF